MIDLSSLNPEQRKAAQQVEGPVLILAGAGSGKTKTITYRMAYMVKNLSIPAQQILAVSFTNKAAQEMEERVRKLLGKRSTARGEDITLCTFHSLGVSILRQELSLLGYHHDFTIYDTSDQMTIVREGLTQLRSDKAFDRKRILAKIGFLKNKGISPEEFPASRFYDNEDPYDFTTAEIYHFYQEKLKFYNAIDFDDLIFLPVKIFKEHPEVAEKYSQRFRYIMVDEYQDTNPLQFQMVLALTSTHQNLCVVGDDDQSIYSFRGADISNILQFEKHFPQTKVIKLEENYRSTPSILKLANTIIRENVQRKDKTMWTRNENQELPLLWTCGHSDHESQVVAAEIKRLNSQEGVNLANIGVLYRSNTQTLPLEDSLRLYQVPYSMIGGQKFYEKKEVKDLIAYLSVIHNPKDQLSLRRILNIPNRGIGMGTLNKFLELGKTHHMDLFTAMETFFHSDPKREKHILEFVQLLQRFREVFRQRPLPDAIRELVTELNFNDFIDKSYENPNQRSRRREDLVHFTESAERFGRYYNGKNPLKGFLERILLQDVQDSQNSKDRHEEGGGNEDKVTLLTLHSSKGLEFDVVFLVGMEEELLPHKKSIVENNLSEERRLCYVGVTRARRKLIMTYCKEKTLYGKVMPRFPSRFIINHTSLYRSEDRTTLNHLSADEVHQYQTQFFNDLIGMFD